MILISRHFIHKLDRLYTIQSEGSVNFDQQTKTIHFLINENAKIKNQLNILK